MVVAKDKTRIIITIPKQIDAKLREVVAEKETTPSNYITELLQEKFEKEIDIMIQIQDTQNFVERINTECEGTPVFPTTPEWVEVEKANTSRDVETLAYRWSDGNQVHTGEANNQDFIRICLEESDQI